MNAGCARALGMSSETKGLKRHRIIYSHVVPNLFLRYIGVKSTLEESEFNGTEKKGLFFIYILFYVPHKKETLTGLEMTVSK